MMRVTSNAAQFARQMERAAKQMPFAIAQTLTAVARDAAVAEQAEIERKFDRPTPFTMKAVRVVGARKDRLWSSVYVMPKTSAYLEPYVAGGHAYTYGKPRELQPGAAPLDRYGGLGRRPIGKLTSRSDVFVGTVKTKAGSIAGVWQRSAAMAKVRGKNGIRNTRRGLNHSGRLKLLIKFDSPHATAPVFKWGPVALSVARRGIDQHFATAFRRAMATAK